MGLQNAICSTGSNLIIRTTHMTGTVIKILFKITDIGLIFGTSLRQNSKDNLWKLTVHIPIVCGFALGSFFGQLAWIYLKIDAMLLPSFFMGGVNNT
jgi:uncharacterized membrane protein YoaK (UPF0700 family)